MENSSVGSIHWRAVWDAAKFSVHQSSGTFCDLHLGWVRLLTCLLDVSFTDEGCLCQGRFAFGSVAALRGSKEFML